MNPDQWLQENYLKEIFSGNFEHLKPLIKELELEPSAKVITIGGTNGKGETARSLEFLLRKSGKTTALLTSPHLVSVTERFNFSGQDVSSSQLLREFERLEKRLVQKISYFEFLFLVFLSLVKEKRPEYVILEVGLGGRLDATNSLDADFVGLTSISRDHQDLLGSSYSKILHEKLGITRQGQRVITAFELDYLNRLTEKYAKMSQLNWQALFIGESNFSLRNQILAKTLAAEILQARIEEEIPVFALRKEFERNSSVFRLYPSHNPEGIRKLFQFLNSTKYNNYEHLVVSFSERPRSDLELMLGVILDHFPADKVYYCKDSFPKCLSEQDVLKLKEKFGFQFFDKDNFFSRISSGQVLVTGSNYFLGHFIKSYSGS